MNSRGIQTQSAIGVTLKLVGTLLALYLVRDAWLDRQTEQLQTVRLERDMDYEQRKAASHDDYAAQLKELRVLLAALVQRLPARLDPPAIEKTLHDQATHAGIEIASLKIGKERVREGFYTELPVQLVVTGSTARLIGFTNDLLRDLPLRQASSMKFEPDADDAATVRAAITLHYYRYVEEEG